MMKKHSLTSKIWKYLVLFSLAILLFLWLFQVIFINKYYEWTKTRHIKQIAQELLTSDTATSIYETLDRISYQENISIEITTADGNGLYASNGNFNLFNDINTFKYQFIESGLSDYTYIFENPRFKDKSITYAVKLNNNLFAFISTSLEPIDSTVKILQEQLLIVTGIVLILSFVIAYFISRYLSKPIIKISKAASRIAAGKMNTTFESDSDISELIALTDALNEMKTELSKTEELQRDLIANVSHDLKTPLTMIKAYAELVRDINYKQKDKREENLNIIIAEVDRMTLLVNDILTLSKMQVALDTLELETFDLIVLVQDIINRFMIFARKDGYRILFEHTSLTSVIIEADKKKLEQVIYNLMTNAINYTGKDKTVTIAITKTDTTYHVEIKDSGKGIDPKDLDHIWDKYYQDKKHHKRQVYGTGLGLSIVKNILILHQYPYGVTSKKGKGTCFYFDIPIKPTD